MVGYKGIGLGMCKDWVRKGREVCQVKDMRIKEGSLTVKNL